MQDCRNCDRSYGDRIYLHEECAGWKNLSSGGVGVSHYVFLLKGKDSKNGRNGSGIKDIDKNKIFDFEFNRIDYFSFTSTFPLAFPRFLCYKVNSVYQRSTIMRESTKATRATILQSAKEIFLECGYQEASMRKIASRAGITPGAIYKHFSGKEEMFGEIFAESGNKLMALSESMLDIDFSAMSDEQLMQVFYSRISIRTLELLEDDMQLFHMLLKNDSGTYIRNFRKVYITRCNEFATRFYHELYVRGLAKNQLSEKTCYMLSLSEFSMICEMIADDTCKDGFTEEMKQAFLEAMDVLMHGIEAALGLQVQDVPNH